MRLINGVSTHAMDYSHIFFMSFCRDVIGVSEPSVSLSTFLLHHLPFSPEQQPLKSSLLRLSLPLDDRNGRCCKIHALFLRSTLNTITVELRPDVTVSNQTSLSFDLVEPSLGYAADNERLIELGPSVTKLLSQNEVK